MNLLIVTVVILGIIAIAQLIRVFELSTALRGERRDGAQVSLAENRMNAKLMMIFLFAFFGFCLWQWYSVQGSILPESASEHGKSIDKLFAFNEIIITIVFGITHIFLFYFAYKYYFRPENKATFFAHSNRLELLWTSVPAVVLAVIIVYGLLTWNKITGEAPDNAMTIEIFAKQFDWTARYPGKDKKLGYANYRLIQEGLNDLGLDSLDSQGQDDILAKGEFHIPVGKPVNFLFRAKDVIHSAYMPHFRAQMNAVPGIITQFHFTPTITTAEMKEKTGNPNFEYVLLCNKICGAAHWNMQMNIVVDTEEDYLKWLKDQPAFFAGKAAAGVPPAAQGDTAAVASFTPDTTATAAH